MDDSEDGNRDFFDFLPFRISIVLLLRTLLRVGAFEDIILKKICFFLFLVILKCWKIKTIHQSVIKQRGIYFTIFSDLCDSLLCFILEDEQYRDWSLFSSESHPSGGFILMVSLLQSFVCQKRTIFSFSRLIWSIALSDCIIDAPEGE